MVFENILLFYSYNKIIFKNNLQNEINFLYV